MRLSFLLISSCLACASAATEAERPNIVLIVADDVGYSDFGCYGGEIQTPSIDRLAREGVRFTQFYNNAVCVPTRASLYTGLYPRYVGESYRIRLTPEIAGTEYPSTKGGQPILPLEGHSLLAALRGRERAGPEALCWASLDNRAVRGGRWKLVWDQDVARWELYDMVTDRTETSDLAEEHPDRVRRMAAAWTAWAERTGAIHQLGSKYRLKPNKPR